MKQESKPIDHLPMPGAVLSLRFVEAPGLSDGAAHRASAKTSGKPGCPLMHSIFQGPPAGYSNASIYTCIFHRQKNYIK
jgi:hypothetical protein